MEFQDQESHKGLVLSPRGKKIVDKHRAIWDTIDTALEQIKAQTTNQQVRRVIINLQYSDWLSKLQIKMKNCSSFN